MNHRFLILVLILFCTTVAARAQNAGLITAKVLADGEPTAYATVILHQAADSAFVKASTTGDDGVFELAGVTPGDYFVAVSYVGFATHSSDVFVFTGGETKRLDDIFLRVASEQLDEVVVVSTRPIVEVHPDKTVFNVEGSINASGNTALELLRKSPGVVVDNNDNVILAGKNGVQIYFDGKPSPLRGEDLAIT